MFKRILLAATLLSLSACTFRCDDSPNGKRASVELKTTKEVIEVPDIDVHSKKKVVELPDIDGTPDGK